MPTFGTGGDPTFNTGTPAWDQALGNLGSALFGGARQGMSGYYYGSEARKAQLESNRAIDTQQGLNYMLTNTPGSGLQPAPFHFIQPTNVPGAPPILATPQGLPVTGTDQGGAPPASAPTTPPASLSSLVAPGDAPNAKGFLQTGNPPPASSPAPGAGAPPAPNTTTSNGQPPPNNAGDGILHPGSVTAPDGGRKESGPASANGSPAPIAFNPNLLVVMMQRAGYSADQMSQNLRAYIANAYNTGVIDRNTFVQMDAALGQGTILTQEAQTQRQRIAIQPEMARVGETAREYNITGGKTMLDANGQPIYVKPGDIKTGAPAYEASAYPVQQGTLTVGGGGPFGTGGSIIPRSALPATGAPAYSAELDKAMNAPVHILNPDGSASSIVIPYGQAVKNGTPVLQDDLDKVRALVAQAQVAKVPPEQAPAKLRETVTGMTPPAPVSAEESLKRSYVIDKMTEERFQPQAGVRMNPQAARLDADVKAWVANRTNQLMDNGPPGVRGDIGAAARQALQEGEQFGYVPSIKDVADIRGKSWNPKDALYSENVIQGQDVNGRPTEFFRVKAKGQIPLSSLVTGPGGGKPAAQPGFTLSAQPVADAPPGAQEGSFVTGSKGGQGVVRGGKIYQLIPSGGQQ